MTTDERALVGADRLAAQFEARRPRMRSVAYRMLGSRDDADDAVQETWFRLQTVDANSLDNLGGWLTTVISRVCLDRLRRRQIRREGPLPRDDHFGTGPSPTSDSDDPVEHVLNTESLGAALLVVLESLGPAERVAFVLHDMFAVPFDELATIVERSPDAARQLASRARRRVQRSAPSAHVDLPRHRAAVEAFLRAARAGDFDALMQVLDPDVVMRVDSTAQRMGALRPRQGAVELGATFAGGAQAAHLAIIDGVVGLVWAPRGDIRGVTEFIVVDRRITTIYVTGEPERLRALDILLLRESD
jgi:RNA polymerase sigma-70 factor (ECF subfamily)